MGTWMGNGYRKFGVFLSNQHGLCQRVIGRLFSSDGTEGDDNPQKSMGGLFILGIMFFPRFGHVFWISVFPASLLFSFSAFCYSACFSAFIVLCFSASPLFFFSASPLFRFSAFPASLLLCFLLFQLLCFSAFCFSLLLCLSAFLLLCFSLFFCISYCR